MPDNGDRGLVEEAEQGRDRPTQDQAPESARRALLCVRPERIDVGVEPDAPETALVDQHQAASISELEREAVPPGLVWLRVEAAGLAALGRLAVLGHHDDAAAHAQVDP